MLQGAVAGESGLDERVVAAAAVVQSVAVNNGRCRSPFPDRWFRWVVGLRFVKSVSTVSDTAHYFAAAARASIERGGRASG